MNTRRAEQGARDIGINGAHWLPLSRLLGTHRSGLNANLGQADLLEGGDILSGPEDGQGGVSQIKKKGRV